MRLSPNGGTQPILYKRGIEITTPISVVMKNCFTKGNRSSDSLYMESLQRGKHPLDCLFSRLAGNDQFSHHRIDVYKRQHPLDKILKNGFFAGHGESRPAKRIETASILGCISLETAQNEMHGGQAIPAFEFYLAPYVRSSFIEEVKVLEELSGENYNHLYHIEISDYMPRELTGLTGEERVLQHAINRTVNRVHRCV